MRAPAPRWQSSSMPRDPRKSSSPATRPKRSTWWRRPGARRTSAKATRSCSRSWSIIPTSCPGISCRERQGAVLKWVDVDDEGNFLIEEFEKQLSPRTKLVAITQMSNALGTIVPVKDVVKIAHARGIPVLVDGSQGAVHLTIDVQDIGADFYVFTGHKLYGPSGIGVLYAKYDHLVSDAALQRRRRNDPRSGARLGHLWRPAAQIRGGHACDRRSDRTWGCDRLCQFDRQGAHRRARARSSDLCGSALARNQLDCG